jgi:hypothetical protein
MSRIFARKEFSNYLGEDRALNDSVISFFPEFPSPTPSLTPPVTQTPTPSVTPAVTQTPTQTGTPTPTPSSTPFLPSANLIMHFDASNLSYFTTTVVTGTTYVDSWEDISPLGNDVLQANTANRPTLISDGYGSYMVNFDGTQYLSGATSPNIASGITAITKFIVFTINNYSGETRINGASPATTDFEGYYVANDGGVWAPVWYPGPRWNNFSGRTKQPNFVTWATKAQSAGSMSGVTNDDVPSGVVFDTWSPEPAITNWYIGTGDDNALSRWKGSIKEIIIYNGLLTQGQIDTIYAALKTKWNYNSW